MNRSKEMTQDKEKLKKKNLLVGWSVGILAIALYVVAIFFK